MTWRTIHTHGDGSGGFFTIQGDGTLNGTHDDGAGGTEDTWEYTAFRCQADAAAHGVFVVVVRKPVADVERIGIVRTRAGTASPLLTLNWSGGFASNDPASPDRFETEVLWMTWERFWQHKAALVQMRELMPQVRQYLLDNYANNAARMEQANWVTAFDAVVPVALGIGDAYGVTE